MITLPDRPTGAQVVAAIEAEAARRNLPTSTFAAPLSSAPAKWLCQARVAKRCKPATIARVLCLLNDEPVPPPPPNSFQLPRDDTRQFVPPAHRGPVPTVEPVNREPCWRCGVRGDIGCSCRNH